MRRITLLVTLVAGLIAAGHSAAIAGKPGGGGSTGGCVRVTPQVNIANNYAWAQSGAWGNPGQKINFAVDVMNSDQGCSASTFSVSLAAPAGFVVSAPVSLSISAPSDAYAWISVTSPTTAIDGQYALTATVTRTGTAAVTATSKYLVYTSDTTAPQIYWTSPAAGSDATGRSLAVGFASTDDHALSRISVAVDGATVATTDCTTNVSYDCLVSYNWSIRRVTGAHTATFTSTDHMGNVASQTVSFTVN